MHSVHVVGEVVCHQSQVSSADVAVALQVALVSQFLLHLAQLLLQCRQLLLVVPWGCLQVAEEG